jgi:hypothetical protein
VFESGAILLDSHGAWVEWTQSAGARQRRNR